MVDITQIFHEVRVLPSDRDALRFLCTAFLCTGVFSAISSIFNTLDLIDPVTVKIKLLIQGLWRRRLNWDTKIPDELIREWNMQRENVIKLSLLNLPRWINFSSNCEVAELHIFEDPSNTAGVTTAHIKVVD